MNLPFSLSPPPSFTLSLQLQFSYELVRKRLLRWLSFIITELTVKLTFQPGKRKFLSSFMLHFYSLLYSNITA